MKTWKYKRAFVEWICGWVIIGEGICRVLTFGFWCPVWEPRIEWKLRHWWWNCDR